MRKVGENLLKCGCAIKICQIKRITHFLRLVQNKENIFGEHTIVELG